MTLLYIVYDFMEKNITTWFNPFSLQTPKCVIGKQCRPRSEAALNIVISIKCNNNKKIIRHPAIGK